MNKRILFATVAAVFAGSALAQLGGGFPGGGMGGRRGGGRDNRDRTGDAPKKAAEAPRVNSLELTLQEFHQDLKLQQPQEPLWQAYADSLRALSTDAARQQR